MGLHIVALGEFSTRNNNVAEIFLDGDLSEHSNHSSGSSGVGIGENAHPFRTFCREFIVLTGRAELNELPASDGLKLVKH
jgi:hypothetical protein